LGEAFDVVGEPERNDPASDTWPAYLATVVAFPLGCFL
jgi:hypothetical protein